MVAYTSVHGMKNSVPKPTTSPIPLRMCRSTSLWALHTHSNIQIDWNQIDSTHPNLQVHCYQFVTISQPTGVQNVVPTWTYKLTYSERNESWDPYRQHQPTLWRVFWNLQFHQYHLVCAGRLPCEHSIPTQTYELTWPNWLYPPKPTSSLLPIWNYQSAYWCTKCTHLNLQIGIFRMQWILRPLQTTVM